MYYFKTYKEKLKEDRKVVLQYQLVTGTSLKDIDPSLSIKNMKADTEYYLRYKKGCNKVMNGVVYQDINTEEDLFKIKHFAILNHVNAQCYLHDLSLMKYDHSSKTNKDIIKLIIKSIKKYTEYSITLMKYYYNNEQIYKIYIKINIPPTDKKLYCKYLQQNVKILREYQVNLNKSLSHIISTRARISTLENYENPCKHVCKKIKMLSTLNKMNFDNMKNVTFYINIEDCFDDFDEFNFDNIKDLFDFINDKKLYELNLISIEYHKYIINVTDVNISIVIRYEDTTEIEQDVVIVNDLKTIESFTNYTFTHGLFAYNRNVNSINEKMDKLINDENIAICCSWTNEFVGPFGVYVQGDCKIASLFDLGSAYNKDTGERYVLKDRLQPDWLINSPSKILSSNIVSGEAIITNPKIVGIWKDKNYEDKDGYVEIIKKITGIKEVKLIKSTHMNNEIK